MRLSDKLRGDGWPKRTCSRLQRVVRRVSPGLVSFVRTVFSFCPFVDLGMTEEKSGGPFMTTYVRFLYLSIFVMYLAFKP